MTTDEKTGSSRVWCASAAFSIAHTENAYIMLDVEAGATPVQEAEKADKHQPVERLGDGRCLIQTLSHGFECSGT